MDLNTIEERSLWRGKALLTGRAMGITTPKSSGWGSNPLILNEYSSQRGHGHYSDGL